MIQIDEISQKKEETKCTAENEVEPLVSCDKCDYDSDKPEDIEKHKAIGIHDIHYQNTTIEETVEAENRIHYNCDFCEYKASDYSSIEVHGEKEHSSFRCKRCKYRALDKNRITYYFTLFLELVIQRC